MHYYDVYKTQTIKLLVPKTPKAWMEKRDPEEVEIDARVNWENKLVKTIEGEEVVSSVNIDIDYDATIYFDYGVEIDSVPFTIVQIRRIDDFSTQFMKVYLK